MNTKTLASVIYTKKLAKIERDVLELKKGTPFRSKSFISLRGIIKGIRVSEKEIGRAKKSLFKS